MIKGSGPGKFRGVSRKVSSFGFCLIISSYRGLESLEFGVWGLGFRAWHLGFRV